MNWEDVLRFPGPEYVPDTVHEYLMLTVVYWPPERICAIDLEMDGFSATHNTRMYYAKINGSCFERCKPGRSGH